MPTPACCKKGCSWCTTDAKQTWGVNTPLFEPFAYVNICRIQLSSYDAAVVSQSASLSIMLQTWEVRPWVSKMRHAKSQSADSKAFARSNTQMHNVLFLFQARL